MAGSRLGAGRHFGDDQPALEHRPLPRLILGRIENVDAAGDDADRAAVQRAVMGRAVDAAGQAGDDDQSLAAEVVGQPAREAAGRGGSVAGADDGDGRPVEHRQIALGDEQGRRVVLLGQQARIEALPERQVARAELLDPLDFARGVAFRRTAGRAARRRAGRGRARRPAPPPAMPKRAISWWKVIGPMPGRAQQPDAVNQVLGHCSLPMRGSVPAFRRARFARCFHTTRRAKPSSIGKSDRSPSKAALMGALTAAAMPATDEIRTSSSRPSQTTA